MAKILKDETATALLDLLDKRGARRVGDPMTPKDLSGVDTSVKSFKVAQAGSNSITVWRGTWTRNGLRIALTLDSGKDYKTVSGFSGTSTTYDVYIQLGSDSYGLEPTVLTASMGASPITAETYGLNQKFIVAKVTTDSSGNISTIEQLHLGDLDDSFNYWDNLSTWYNSVYQTEIKGWSAASSGGVALATDLILAQATASMRVVKFLSISDLSNSTDMANTFIQNFNDHATTLLTKISISGLNHEDLQHRDNDANSHSLLYWLMGGASTRNYGGSIGRTDSSMAIDLTNSYLKDATGPTTTVDWHQRQLLGGNWTITSGNKFLAADTTKSTAADTGAVQVKGGVWAGKGFRGEKGSGDQAAYFEDGTNSVYMCEGTYAVHASVGPIDGNPTSGFSIAGTKVVGAQGAAVADATGTGDVVAQLNALLARLRTHGLIAT